MQRIKNIRIIIDTNIFISFLIGRRISGLKEHIVNFKIKLIFTEQLIQEIKLVTKRPRLKKYFSPKDVEEMIQLIYGIGDNVEIAEEPELCRDPKDNFLLALSDKGRANFLVTGDKDLLILKKYKTTSIITYTDLEKMMLTM
ncbi:MAG: putative toxin-antitoxin system toxin component, PIN family [Bacteroidales bacterium]